MAVVNGNGERADKVRLYGNDDHTTVILPDGSEIFVHSTGFVVRYQNSGDAEGKPVFFN